ncbi:MAG TPA: ABC transporter ATP-binding protein, partial [Candidatus Pelethocola excrementipullorum]|nr:ABC transporter ATP-binding protein [Candidatus Pelethocola excrementipullorum]
KKVQDISISDVNKFGVASLLTRTTSDVENVSISGVLFIQMIIPAPMISIVSIIMTYTVSKRLIWIPLLVIFLFIIVVIEIMHHGNKYSRIIQKKMDHIMRSIREFYTGIRVIRAFDNEKIEKNKTDHTFRDYADNMISLNKCFSLMTPAVEILMGAALTAILWFGVMEVGEGNIQVGSVTAIVEYVVLTLMYLMTAAMVLIALPNAIASIHRISEVLDYSPEIKERKNLSKVARTTTGDELVSFNNVTFTYPDAEAPVLNNISFKVKRGETIAIVGSTGSGKSTIAKLLLRFNDVSAGSIKINGQDVREVSQNQLRDAISFVPQKAFLFNGNIKENLIYGNERAIYQEIERATKVAQVYDFIQSLPDKFDSFVAQGGFNFSGGQRQRLSIARALVKKADVYVFDDSFSALDYKTDSLIRSALKKEMKNVAMIIVAQRLSTVMEADQIVILHEGRVVGLGKHQELLESNEIYRSFAISQQLIKEERN